MEVREFVESDLDRVRELHEKFHKDGFDFPDIERAIAATVIAEGDGRIVAFGMIRPIIESVMILDLGRRLRDKAAALELLLIEADFRAGKAGFDQTHAFVQGDFSGIMKSHFGFRPCKGEALVREI